MIHFQEFTLANGLRVIVHEDFTTPMAVLNVLYDVGSRDEEESRTGFAHLFEHLMFSGSVNIPSYDEPLTRVGGENNAFTSPDITNYYLTVPSVNIETGFWLESDRMLGLAFSENGLEVQRKVVVEEFKQRYLNQPYGDVWLKLKPVVYQKHPYKWLTIGKNIEHIEEATMDEVRSFFKAHYMPNNAIAVVAGNVPFEQAKALTEKWFGDIPAGQKPERNLPQEPRQTEARFLEVRAAVPQNALYKTYHMPARTDPDYYPADLLSDVLGRDKSARLYDKLVKERQVFTSIGASVTGSLNPGLLVIQGRVSEGVDIKEADEAVAEIVAELRANVVPAEELQKVKNQAESTLIFSDIDLLNRAMNLAFHKLLGDANGINTEAQKIQAVTPDDLYRMAQEVLRPENCTTLYYLSEEGQTPTSTEETEETVEDESQSA